MNVSDFQKNLWLYLFCILVWGSTWLVIKFQIDTTTPIVSVFYRFALSALILFAANFFYKNSLKCSPSFHLIFLFQGLFNFSLNYVLTYIAEAYTASGIIALTFTTLVYFNIIGMSVFFKKTIQRNVISGSLIGGLGVILLFFDDIKKLDFSSGHMVGVGLGLLASVCASLGNMFSYKSYLNKVPVLISNNWSMFYGCLFTLLLGLLSRQNFSVDWHPQFIVSLLYLSIFGTVLAFGAYFLLVGRMGAEKASYISVISPTIALMFSALFENLTLTPMLVIGMILCIAGNILTLGFNHNLYRSRQQ